MTNFTCFDCAGHERPNGLQEEAQPVSRAAQQQAEPQPRARFRERQAREEEPQGPGPGQVIVFVSTYFTLSCLSSLPSFEPFLARRPSLWSWCAFCLFAFDFVPTRREAVVGTTAAKGCDCDVDASRGCDVDLSRCRVFHFVSLLLLFGSARFGSAWLGLA